MVPKRMTVSHPRIHLGVPRHGGNGKEKKIPAMSSPKVNPRVTPTPLTHCSTVLLAFRPHPWWRRTVSEWRCGTRWSLLDLSSDGNRWWGLRAQVLSL